MFAGEDRILCMALTQDFLIYATEVHVHVCSQNVYTVRYIDDLLTLNNATFDAVIGLKN